MTEREQRRLLYSWRQYYQMTQATAAMWLYLPLGTYRDIEQGRKKPSRIVWRGIQARMDDCDSDALCEAIPFAFDPEIDLIDLPKAKK